MKYDKEEKELIKTIEKDEWRTVRDINISKGKMQKAARSTMLKDQRMNQAVDLTPKGYLLDSTYYDLLRIIDR